MAYYKLSDFSNILSQILKTNVRKMQLHHRYYYDAEYDSDEDYNTMLYNFVFNKITIQIIYSQRILDDYYLSCYIKFNSNKINYSIVNDKKHINTRLNISDNLQIEKTYNSIHFFRIIILKICKNNNIYNYIYDNKYNSLILDKKTIIFNNYIIYYKNIKISSIVINNNNKYILTKIFFYYKNYLIFKLAYIINNNDIFVINLKTNIYNRIYNIFYIII